VEGLFLATDGRPGLRSASHSGSSVKRMPPTRQSRPGLRSRARSVVQSSLSSSKQKCGRSRDDARSFQARTLSLPGTAAAQSQARAAGRHVRACAANRALFISRGVGRRRALRRYMNAIQRGRRRDAPPPSGLEHRGEKTRNGLLRRGFNRTHLDDATMPVICPTCQTFDCALRRSSALGHVGVLTQLAQRTRVRVQEHEFERSFQNAHTSAQSPSQEIIVGQKA
jgi:hypothetical protein